MGTPSPKMDPGPSQMIEAIVGVLLPPACREEVLGDLHERCRSRGLYVLEAARTVPFVILSRIRRTTDPGVLLLEACALYLAFVAGIQVSGDARFLIEQNGYERLAGPVLMALPALVLVDAYASPHRRMLLGTFAAGGAILLQVSLQATNPKLALPSDSMMALGALVGMLLVAALRLLFAPDDHRPTGAG